MNEHHNEIVELALDKLFNEKGYFSICTVDTLAKTLGVNCASHREYKYLSTLHCVDYADMSDELKAKLPAMVMAVLSGRFDTGLMALTMAALATGEVKGLPNTEDDCPTRVLTR